VRDKYRETSSRINNIGVSPKMLAKSVESDCVSMGSHANKGSVSPPRKKKNLPEEPKIFVRQWVDYSSKYGVGYKLSDEVQYGVYLNDGAKVYFDHYTKRLVVV
jgi:hypothetical protein